MKYRKDKYGNELSILGFGCMRFPMKMGIHDMKEIEKEITWAVEQGINYFDTAYVYPGSESALGMVLEKNKIRDKVFIASKLPHYLIKTKEKLNSMFEEQLKRLKTDRIDYYLMHMLTDVDTWKRLCGLGIKEWIEEKKRTGQIGQIGFSYHGNSDAFIKLIDAYDWDFCQIQYNYMDENTQAGRRGLEYAASKEIPVVIMEPLRGGKLVKHLPAEAKEIFASHSPKHTPAQWAFKWLWDQPQVTVVLSGMNSMEMLEDNVKTASETETGELTEADIEMLDNVTSAINSKMKVGCTGCGYCMPCPKNVDIPGVFAAYNRRYSEGKFWSLVEYVICTSLRKNSTSASNCIGCGKCEKHCPQGINIRDHLNDAKREMEGPVYRFLSRVISRFAKF